jgi:hypothetical protein
LASREWRASKSCAYSFVLAASSRVQNGYSLVFPHTQDFNNLTILLGSGEGSTECPDDRIIIKPIIDPLIPIKPIIDPIIIKPGVSLPTDILVR